LNPLSHAGFVALFLIVGHIAMIFGMLDPAVLYAGGGTHSHLARLKARLAPQNAREASHTAVS
jgi:hypothetical protein